MLYLHINTINLIGQDIENMCSNYIQGVHWILCFFPRNLESLLPFPRHHSADIVCTKKCQPIRVTVHSQCVECLEGLLQQWSEGGIAVNCEKNTIFPKHPVSLHK